MTAATMLRLRLRGDENVFIEDLSEAEAIVLKKALRELIYMNLKGAIVELEQLVRIDKLVECIFNELVRLKGSVRDIAYEPLFENSLQPNQRKSNKRLSDAIYLASEEMYFLFISMDFFVSLGTCIEIPYELPKTRVL